MSAAIDPSPTDASLERVVDAQCALLGLELAPAHRPGVLVYTRLVAAMAPLVMDFPLSSRTEPANVFVPVSPARRRAPEDTGTGAPLADGPR
ncbi:MAG: DUF4089 domain-containing protein [Lautropia sp.]